MELLLTHTYSFLAAAMFSLHSIQEYDGIVGIHGELGDVPSLTWSCDMRDGNKEIQQKKLMLKRKEDGVGESHSYACVAESWMKCTCFLCVYSTSRRCSDFRKLLNVMPKVVLLSLKKPQGKIISYFYTAARFDSVRALIWDQCGLKVSSPRVSTTSSWMQKKVEYANFTSAQLRHV